MKIAEYNEMMAYLTRPEPEVLPQPKPQELLDIQEDNRKGRLLESLNKIGGRLEDSSLDFINRENFAEAGGVFGNTAEKREKTLKDIKKYFDKQIQKGPVSMSDMEKKFPKQARVTITKALGENANKLTRVTPLQTKFKNKVSKIINDVYDNKKPLINASPRRIFKELYGREFKIDKDNTGVIKKIIQSDLDLLNKYNELTPKITNTSTRVGAGNKLFESVKVKDFDEVFSESIKKRGVTRAGTVEEFILRDLKRHIDQGGKKFEFTKNNTFDKGFKGLKIKDLKKGDIIDFNSIKKDDPRFKEYKQVFKDIKKLKLTPYVNPITKEKTTLMEGLQKATNIQAPLHIQHNKGVANDPLKNLSIQTFKANIGAKMVETPEQAKKLGVQTTVPGSKKVVGPKLSFKDQVNRLTKFSDRMIKGAGTRELKTPKQTLFKPGMQPDGRLVDLPGGNKKGMNLAFAEALGTAAEKGKIYGPKYAKQIVNMARPAAKLTGLELLLGSAFAPLDIGEGRPMKDVALNVATLGMGVPVKDAKRASAFADKYGLKEDLFTAKMKLAGANKIRGDQEIELTNNEEKALQAETYFKENILQPELDELRTIRQEESDPMFGLTDLGMAEGGRINYSNGSDGTDLAIKESLEAFERYLKAGGKLGYKDFIALGNEGVSKFFNKGGRVNFASGSGPMPVRLIYIIMDRLRNLKNSTFSNYNQVRMYGEQKGITELLEPYKNIPNKNRVTSAIDDAEELKKFMPDEYKPILDEIIDDTKQFKFKTAHDKQQALEKVLPEELKFENLPEEMFPMPNPENPNFIMPYGYPDKNPFQKSRITTRTEADKFTGKGTRKTYDTFNEKTKQYQEPSKNTLISEEPIDEELESIIRDLDKGDLQ